MLSDSMKLTGERPLEGKTPPALLALHEAGYREVVDRLGPGRVLDVGCGVGDYSQRMAGDGRTVLGVDYDAATASTATRAHPGLQAIAADGARVPLRTGAVDWACSSHLIEHFHDPEPHVAELARVVSGNGAAFVITPNAPADFENPYHVHLFEPTELQAMLGRHFHDVEVLGLDGDAVVKADFERRRQIGRAVLRLDVFDLRHRVPARWYEALHAAGRRLVYPLVNRTQRDQPPIDASRFSITQAIDPTTLVLFAVARRPKR
jgi:SAM-dependent methyltransferase